MEKFQVWVDLKDRRYAKRLAEFLMLRYNEIMQVDLVNEVNYKPNLESILLTDREERKEAYGQILWVSVEEGLNPYQSGHKIAREILKMKENWHLKEEVSDFKGRKGEWISVYSPVGGIGKSTLAMGLADILACRKKVLFISLEGPSAWNLFFRYPLSYNLSDFFYCFLMGGPDDWKKRISEMTYQQKNGVYFLPPCQYPDDMLELRDSEIISWMELMKENFDYVIADMGCLMLRPNRVILKHSSKQCFVVDTREEGRKKWQNFSMEQEALSEQWIFSRYGDKSKQGEIQLLEDVDIFEFQEGIKQFSRKSMYYKCLEKAITKWT